LKKLIACLACRNSGSRLYGKPLQNLDIKNNISILDYIISYLKKSKSIDEIVLGVAEGAENDVYHSIAKKHNISSISGDEKDVLFRLIKCCKHVNGTDVFRVTSESPFCLYEYIDNVWLNHREKNFDLSTIDNVPNGSGFEIINLNSLEKSWNNGSAKHRSELCTLYIRENKKDFKINFVSTENKLQREDIRLTADYPEDLVLLRSVYEKFKKLSPNIPVNLIIDYLDHNNEIKNLVNKYVSDGITTMYI
tara:strand:+ start:72833 stop:73582 length:750 start_codon:yes stop_codon:yes gene_type:complete